PITGAQINGVGGVQQFFEGMGVSKPPIVQLSRNEIRLACKYKETARAEVTLKTPAKKWVYAHITSNSPWLKVITPQVAGPQHAAVGFEVVSNLWNQGPVGEGKLTVEANGGQKLTLRVIVEVQDLPATFRPSTPITKPATPPPATSPIAAESPSHMPTASQAAPPEFRHARLKFVPAFVTTLAMCLLLRLVLVPV